MQKNLSECKDGCGEMVKKDYKPGHDLRHLMSVLRRIAGRGKRKDVTIPEIIDAIRRLEANRKGDKRKIAKLTRLVKEPCSGGIEVSSRVCERGTTGCNVVHDLKAAGGSA